MDQARKRWWMVVACMSVFAVTLVFLPNGSLAQQDTVERISSVTKDYSFEVLLTGMSLEEANNVRQAANWYLDMAKSFAKRSAEIKRQIDMQREAKKAEIKALEARTKVAESAKDEVLKKQLEASVKEQKLQLEILESIKKLSEKEASVVAQCQATGQALEDMAVSHELLSKARESVLKDHEKAVAAATQAGLPAPTSPIDYELNGKALKSLGEVGKNMKDLGEGLKNVADIRQELVNNWKKLSETRAKM